MDINENMRAMLIDWLVDVHNKFQYHHQTLAMTVNMIDRYISKVPITKLKLQLIGITCLFMAGKYEEIYPLDLKDYVNVCDGNYNANQLIETEGHILLALNWDLVFNSSFYFYEMFAKHLNLKTETYNLGLMLLNLCMLEYHMNKFRSSVVALAVVY